MCKKSNWRQNLIFLFFVVRNTLSAQGRDPTQEGLKIVTDIDERSLKKSLRPVR